MNAGQSSGITFTVPANAAGGATVLRVRELFQNNHDTITDPCGNDFDYGESEDYSVTIQGIAINNPSGYATGKTITAAYTGLVALSGSLSYAMTGTNSCTSGMTFTGYQSLSFTGESSNGQYVCYHATDISGNNYYTNTQITGIDTTLPFFSGSVTPFGSYVGTSNVAVMWSSFDNISGISGTYYTLSTNSAFTGIVQTGFTSATGFTFVGLSDNSIYWVNLQTFDNVGFSVFSSGFFTTAFGVPVINGLTPASGSTTRDGAISFSWTATSV